MISTSNNLCRPASCTADIGQYLDISDIQILDIIFLYRVAEEAGAQ